MGPDEVPRWGIRGKSGRVRAGDDPLWVVLDGQPHALGAAECIRLGEALQTEGARAMSAGLHVDNHPDDYDAVVMNQGAA